MKEAREILGYLFEIVSLEDINYTTEIPEPFDTILQNAIYKAQYFYNETGHTCIAEDSGLEVEALGGRPGAYSARYAGDEKNDEKNIEKLLEDMENEKNRDAQFISIFTYIKDGNVQVFEGKMKGKIIETPRGKNGFGYDPIFVANGQRLTNAELDPVEKNQISHRRKALDLLTSYLNTIR